MRHRPLGPSGISASVVGLGTWAIGGWMWGGSSEAESIAAIHASIEAGVSLIDTAPIYGFGLSEAVVGKAIYDRRDKVVLATKCGLVVDTDQGEHMCNSTCLGPDPLGQVIIRRYLAPSSIRKEIEGSLKRLRTDYIDLYQTHWQDGSTPIEDTLSELLQLKREGKIRAIGVSNASVGQISRYLERGVIDADQERYSMIDRDAEGDQVRISRERGLAFLAYSPMARGLLTGKIGPDMKFSDGDNRSADPNYSVENRKRIATLLESCDQVAKGRGMKIGQIVIAWTLAQPGVTHGLCGARNADQAIDNAKSGDIVLSGEEMQIIDAAVAQYSKSA